MLEVEIITVHTLQAFLSLIARAASDSGLTLTCNWPSKNVYVLIVGHGLGNRTSSYGPGHIWYTNVELTLRELSSSAASRLMMLYNFLICGIDSRSR